MQDSSVLYSPDVDADPGRDPGPPHSVGSLNQFPFMGAAIMQIVEGWVAALFMQETFHRGRG